MQKYANRLGALSLAMVLLCCMAISAYAISRLFFSQSITSDFRKKQIFEFDLTAGTMLGEVGPGDSVPVNPVIRNSATEDMYVFIEINTPVCESGSLYEYDVGSDWTLIERAGGGEVFAYGGNQLTKLFPGESTTPLMTFITMKRISNAEYSELEDINIAITGYAIDCQGYTAVPSEVWNEIKAIK